MCNCENAEVKYYYNTVNTEMRKVLISSTSTINTITFCIDSLTHTDDNV